MRNPNQKKKKTFTFAVKAEWREKKTIATTPAPKKPIFFFFIIIRSAAIA